MAAPSLLEVMQGLADRLVTIDGLSVSLEVPDEVTAPHAAIGVPPVSNYHSTMARGMFEMQPTITVYTSSADGFYGQTLLAEFASPTGVNSIRAAIEGDRTLGGVVSDCVVQSFEPQGSEPVGSLEYYVGTFTLLCVAPGA